MRIIREAQDDQFDSGSLSAIFVNILIAIIDIDGTSALNQAWYGTTGMSQFANIESATNLFTSMLQLEHWVTTTQYFNSIGFDPPTGLLVKSITLR